MEREKGKNLLVFPENCCIIDLETTGLDTEYDEIIEVAALRIRNGQITESFSRLVKPASEISEFITELTGITTEMVQDAPTISEVLGDYISFIGNDTVVGHNVNFDINFIYDTAVKLGLPLFQNDYADTMRIARVVLPELQHHRLKDLTKHYQIENLAAHRAAGDCNTTLKLLNALKADATSKAIDLTKFKKHKLRAADLTAQTDEFDISHPLYGKVCVFTGALNSMQRKDAMQIVLNLGGNCADNVTKKTDFLIIGDTEYCTCVKNGKTGKMKKAEDLILKGNDLTILSEDAFIDLVEC